MTRDGLGWPTLMACVAAISPCLVGAFQIGPVGPKLEARLTNETESSLLRYAERLGRLLKWPVHEEITQIAFDCPAKLADIFNDKVCGSSDAGYADAFVMYGVRWNDLPPFRLNPGQGGKCKKALSGAPACRADQTVRFATQPECWLCLFKEAETVAETKRITGCQRGKVFVQGTLMTRSHFGDLQFLHAMADATGVAPEVTRTKLLDWVQFAWRVIEEEFGPEHKLKDIDIPTIREHFGCADWTVSDIYVLGVKDTMNRRIPDIAFGSIVHTVQDSFAAGHAEREPATAGAICADAPSVPRPGEIVEFHAYGAQDGHKHDSADAREVLVNEAIAPSAALRATRELFNFWYDNASWKDVQPFFQCVFALSPNARPSSAGAQFARIPK